MGFFKRENKEKALNKDNRESNNGVITLYTLSGNFENVKSKLIEHFSNMTKGIETSAAANADDSFILRLNDDSEIKLNITTNKEFIASHIPGMCNYFAQAKCENQTLHRNVLAQIQMFNCVVGCIYTYKDKKSADDILNVLFAAADAIKGLVLTPDMKLFDGKRKLVFSIEGESDFVEYTITGNADYEETISETARRERSILILKEKGIPYLANLPAAATGIESESNKLRTPDEIAQRLFAMFGVCVYCETRGSGQTWDETRKYLNKINDILKGGLDNALSSEEKAFLSVKEPEQSDLWRFGWRYECCHVLMWALGMLDELGYPSQVCDVSALGKIIWRQDSLADFLEKAKPHDKDEILDTADLIMRYDWACVDSRVKGKPSPEDLNGEVVVEWHYALNWLIGANGGADWDDVKTYT